MSGVFLIVQETERKPNESLLQPTRGGYPHITLVYSGSKLSTSDLVITAEMAFRRWVQDADQQLPILQLEAKDAYVNSFTEERKGVKRERHDVLLRLSEDDTKIVNRLRSLFVSDNTLSMHPPHVTHSVHYEDKAAAEAALAELKPHLPITVQVTGWTVD